MKNLKLLGLAVFAAIGASVLFGTATASATELYKATSSGFRDTLSAGTELVATLRSGSSTRLETQEGVTLSTCTGSEMKGQIEGPASGAAVSGKISGLAFTGCTSTTDVISPGGLSITWTSGTNGKVSSWGAEVTILLFGLHSICKTGGGTDIGTLTGVKAGSEFATFDISAQLSCSGWQPLVWTGTYTVTSPAGLGVEETQEPTGELYKNTAPNPNDTLGAGTELAMSLESGTSLLLKDSAGTTTETCTGSEVKGKTEVGGTTVTAPVSTLTYTGCSHTTKVLKPGKLHIAWSSGTDGTVSWSESEVTVISTAFGASAICKSGAGTTLGSLTGAKSKTDQATLDVNAKISCGILGTATLTGTYKVTSPTGLVVEGS
jgi:hypothetical protein